MPTKQRVDRYSGSRTSTRNNRSGRGITDNNLSRGSKFDSTSYRPQYTSNNNSAYRNSAPSNMGVYTDTRYPDRGYNNNSGYRNDSTIRPGNTNYSGDSSYVNSGYSSGARNRMPATDHYSRTYLGRSDISYAPARNGSYSYNPPRINVGNVSGTADGYYVPSQAPVPGYKQSGAVERSPRRIQKKQLTAEEKLANKKKAKSRFMSVLGIMVLFLMCVVMIYRQTAIFGMNQEINKLNSQYNAAIVTNEGVQASIDKSVELGNLEAVAKNELGMVEPDSSHVFYIDMAAKDEVVKSLKNK